MVTSETPRTVELCVDFAGQCSTKSGRNQQTRSREVAQINTRTQERDTNASDEFRMTAGHQRGLADSYQSSVPRREVGTDDCLVVSGVDVSVCKRGVGPADAALQLSVGGLDEFGATDLTESLRRKFADYELA